MIPILLSNPFAVLLPRKTRQAKPKSLDWQYHIRVGEHPKISYYSCSDFLFSGPEQARYSAERECIRNGINIFRAMIFVIKKGNNNGKAAEKAQKVRAK